MQKLPYGMMQIRALRTREENVRYEHRTIDSFLRFCIEHHTDMLVLKSRKNEAIEAHAYHAESSGPKKIDLPEYSLSFGVNQLQEYIHAFSFNSQLAKDIFPGVSLEAKNLLISSPQGIYIGKISQELQSETESKLTIHFLKTTFTQFNDIVSVPVETSILLQKISRDTSGIILLNNTDIFAKILINSSLPNVRFCDIQTCNETWEKTRNTDVPIVILHQFEDPIDGFVTFVEHTKMYPALASSIDEISASLTLKFLRKQCGSCAKPTAVSSDSIQKFPEFYQNLIPRTYQFSRGCTQCGYTSYKGYTFLESMFIPSDQIKSSVKLNVNLHDIYTAFFSKKDASIYNNAINHILSGMLSIEEVIRALPQITFACNNFLRATPANTTFTTPSHVSRSDKKNILIVEDDENQREVLKVVFANEGYQVYTADNGKSALSILSQTPMHIILSDLMMPEMNGLELLKYCRKDETLKRLPVIMLTASSNPDHELKLLEEGADDYCPKNVKKKVLLKRVENLLERSNKSSNPVSHFLEE